MPQTIGGNHKLFAKERKFTVILIPLLSIFWTLSWFYCHTLAYPFVEYTVCTVYSHFFCQYLLCILHINHRWWPPSAIFLWKFLNLNHVQKYFNLGAFKVLNIINIKFGDFAIGMRSFPSFFVYIYCEILCFLYDVMVFNEVCLWNICYLFITPMNSLRQSNARWFYWLSELCSKYIYEISWFSLFFKLIAKEWFIAYYMLYGISTEFWIFWPISQFNLQPTLI